MVLLFLSRSRCTTRTVTALPRPKPNKSKCEMFKELIDSNAHCVHIMLALPHLNEVLVVLDDDVVLVELPVHVRLRPALRIQEDSISA